MPIGPNASMAHAKLLADDAPSSMLTGVDTRSHLTAFKSVVAVVRLELHLSFDTEGVVDIDARIFQFVVAIQSELTYRALELFGSEVLLDGLPNGVSVGLCVNNVFTNLNAGQKCLAMTGRTHQ